MQTFHILLGVVDGLGCITSSFLPSPSPPLNKAADGSCQSQLNETEKNYLLPSREMGLRK